MSPRTTILLSLLSLGTLGLLHAARAQDVGDDRASSDGLSQMMQGVDPSRCSFCHTPGYSDLGHASVGGEDSATSGCTTCHTTGGELDALGHFVLSRPSDADCQGCHEGWKDAGHPEVAAGRCTTCHDPHADRGRKTSSWPEREARACSQCHVPPTQAQTTHTIVRRGECSGCHDLHGPAGEGLLHGGTASASCAGCHPDQAVPGEGEEWAIGPDRCDACHDSHASDQPDLLILPEAELCATCHDPLSDLRHPHSAVTLGRCSGCHEPHGDQHDADLGRQVADSASCFSCHADDVTQRPVVHQPVADGECASCHNGHGSDFPAGLHDTQEVVCLSCHADQDRRGALHPHLAVSAQCSTCHDSHGSSSPWLLPDSVNRLCTSCHPDFVDGGHVTTGNSIGGRHPVGPGGKDPLRPDHELSCTSCHDPHGSDNENLWYRAPDTASACRECHGDLYGSSGARRTLPRKKTDTPDEDSSGSAPMRPPVGSADPPPPFDQAGAGPDDLER